MFFAILGWLIASLATIALLVIIASEWRSRRRIKARKRKLQIVREHQVIEKSRIANRRAI